MSKKRARNEIKSDHLKAKKFGNLIIKIKLQKIPMLSKLLIVAMAVASVVSGVGLETQS